MMFGVGAPGACVEHVSSSLVSYLCLRPFQANGGGMKLSSEIARTKKKMFFFLLFSYPLCKLIKKTEITQAEMTQCTRAKKQAVFFVLIQELRHTCMHQQRHTF